MKTRISVQERLKDLRVERGLNLEELAQEGKRQAEGMGRTLQRQAQGPGGGGRRHRGTESPQSHALDWVDEYTKSTDRGNDFSRVDLRMRF